MHVNIESISNKYNSEENRVHLTWILNKYFKKGLTYIENAE